LLNQHRPSISRFFGLDENISIDILIEFIQSNPKQWLPEKFIEFKKIEIQPGFSVAKVIEKELLDMPDISGLVAAHNEIKASLEKIKFFGFIHAFSKLYSEKEDIFNLESDVDFIPDLDNFLSVYTTSAEQNVILTLLENLLEVLNDMDSIGLIKIHNGFGELENIQNFFIFKERCFGINSKIFLRIPQLKKYGDTQSVKKHEQDFASIFQ
jgi:hypothetical protein